MYDESFVRSYVKTNRRAFIPTRHNCSLFVPVYFAFEFTFSAVKNRISLANRADKNSKERARSTSNRVLKKKKQPSRVTSYFAQPMNKDNPLLN